MLVYAGIDEAGYGSMLGPLSVACAAFVIDDHDPADGAPNLWTALRSAVCRKRRDRKDRVAIDDSKKLKGASSSADPLKDLERGVLAFLGAAGEIPSDDAGLRVALGAALDDEPWHGGPPVRLPMAGDAGRLAVSAARVRRASSAAGVRLVRLACETIDAGTFNERLDRSGNKAHINFDAAMRHAARVWDAFAEHHPRIVIDRHGGRTHYRQALQCAFPEAHISIVAETEALSRYRLDREGPGQAGSNETSSATITFTADAEARHLPVALASMTAKYSRELAMIRLNRFFMERVPDLRPTAGYVEDGRRFVGEIEPVVKGLCVPRHRLVRLS